MRFIGRCEHGGPSRCSWWVTFFSTTLKDYWWQALRLSRAATQFLNPMINNHFHHPIDLPCLRHGGRGWWWWWCDDDDDNDDNKFWIWLSFRLISFRAVRNSVPIFRFRIRFSLSNTLTFSRNMISSSTVMLSTSSVRPGRRWGRWRWVMPDPVAATTTDEVIDDDGFSVGAALASSKSSYKSSSSVWWSCPDIIPNLVLQERLQQCRETWDTTATSLRLQSVWLCNMNPNKRLFRGFAFFGHKECCDGGFNK